MKPFLITCLAAGTALWGAASLGAAAPGTNTPSAQLTIPYVPTRHDTVRDLLWMANVGTNDVVYDLGSGDGRVVIAAVRDFGARKGVGIELDPQLVRESRENAARAGVADRVEFIHGDLFTNDFSPASVVVLYLAHYADLDLRAQIVRTLKPGARVVSHQYGMGEWPPDKEFKVRTQYLGMIGFAHNDFANNPEVPDFGNIQSIATHDTLSMWIVPAPIAGVWRGKVRLGEEEQELKLTLHQRLAGVKGSAELQGATNTEGFVRVDLWGDHVRFDCHPSGQPNIEMMFDGHVSGDAMKGTLAVFERDKVREIQWEGRREKSSFTGTWEWPGRTNAPVAIRIERRGGQLAAAYVDDSLDLQTQEIPIRDIYDFGGGFYFTLLLGLEEGSTYTHGSRSMCEGCGWLIGEGIANENAVTGTIAFYPYYGHGTNNVQAGRRDWLPKKVKP